MSKKFKIARDATGSLAYGLDIIGNKIYTGSYQIDGIAEIPLAPEDKFAVFLGASSGVFQVSADPSFPAPTAVPAGGPTILTTPSDSMGVSVLDLSVWDSNNFTSLYIKALAAITLTVHIYSGNA